MGFSLRSWRADLPLLGWLLLGAALNLGLAAYGAYGWDAAAWVRRIDALQHGGYAAAGTAGPPLSAHWLWLCARLLTLLHADAQPGIPLRLLVLAPVLAAQLALLLLVYRIERAQPPPHRFPWLMVLAALNPALLIAGPMQGQLDLVYCLLLACALHLLIAGRYRLLVFPLLTLALLCGYQSLALLPVLLPLLWHRRGNILWAGILPALLLGEFALLPYWLAGSTLSMLGANYSAGGLLHTAADAWACNLWYLLGFAGVSAALPAINPGLLPGGIGWLLTPHNIGLALYLPWSAWLLLSSWRRDDAALHWRNTLLALFGFFLLLPDMGARGLLPAAVLALPAAALHPGLRRHALALTLLAALNLLQLAGTGNAGLLPSLIAAVSLAYALAWGPGAAAWPWLSRPRLLGRLSTPLRLGLAAAIALPLLLALAFHARRGYAPVPMSATVAQAGKPAGDWLDATGVSGRTYTQGWGSLHIGQSVEAHPLTIAGSSWTQGFGTHAPSDIQIPIPAGATRFAASAGIDDEVSGGHLSFQVFADRKMIWDSGAVDSGHAAIAFDLDIAGRQTLDLVVDPLGDKSYDHADWIEPRFRIGG
jgi:hypothetical protein